MSRKGKFQGFIGRVCEYAVYQDGSVIILYKNKENEPCLETDSYDAADKFAGVIGYSNAGRFPMQVYA